MYPSAFSFHRPGTLDEALHLLRELGDDARVLAGGQSLIPMMKLRLAAPSDLIDLSAIAELTGITIAEQRMTVGAMVRHRRFEYGALPPGLPMLHDAVIGIADQQVRNRGTMVGAVANADPGGDWCPVMLAAGATLEISGPDGTREAPIETFFIDAYTPALEPGEIIRSLSIPLTGQPANAFVAFKHRSGDFAIASAAVCLALDPDGVCTSIAVALGNAASKPLLVDAAPDILRGGRPTDRKLAARLGDAAAEAADPFVDTHGSVAYKRSLVRTVTLRALELAARRATGELVDVRSYW